MSNNEYIYEIDGYKVGVDKTKEGDKIGLTVVRQVEDVTYIIGSFWGTMAGFIDLVLKENIQMKEIIQEKNNQLIGKQKDIDELKIVAGFALKGHCVVISKKALNERNTIEIERIYDVLNDTYLYRAI